MRIIVDAMGGDNAPFEIVKGAIRAAQELDVGIILVGRGDEILKSLELLGLKALPEGIDIVDTYGIVEMDDDPIKIVRTKKDSSMMRGLRILSEGYGEAFVSAGSTGALLTGATLIVKRIKGVRRAAMAPVIPCKGGNVMIIDCGATAEGTSEYLLQYAYMGSYYMESVMEVASPRVVFSTTARKRQKAHPCR